DLRQDIRAHAGLAAVIGLKAESLVAISVAAEVQDRRRVLDEGPEQVCGPCRPPRTKPDLVAELRLANLVFDDAALYVQLEPLGPDRVGCEKQHRRGLHHACTGFSGSLQ